LTTVPKRELAWVRYPTNYRLSGKVNFYKLISPDKSFSKISSKSVKIFARFFKAFLPIGILTTSCWSLLNKPIKQHQLLKTMSVIEITKINKLYKLIHKKTGKVIYVDQNTNYLSFEKDAFDVDNSIFQEQLI
jgi:hypothetical protein